jgi:hypothetical protein
MLPPRSYHTPRSLILPAHSTNTLCLPCNVGPAGACGEHRTSGGAPARSTKWEGIAPPPQPPAPIPHSFTG